MSRSLEQKIDSNNRSESGIKFSRTTGYSERIRLIDCKVINGSSDPFLYLIKAKNCSIENCIADSGTGYGIELADCFYTILSGNIVRNITYAEGITVSNSQLFQIMNNFCSSLGLEGIKIENSSKFQIANNTCMNNGQETAETYSGITLSNGDYSILKGNLCSDDQASKTQKYGIEVLSTCDRVIITSNYLYGNSVGALWNQGTNTVVGGNLTA